MRVGARLLNNFCLLGTHRSERVSVGDRFGPATRRPPWSPTAPASPRSNHRPVCRTPGRRSARSVPASFHLRAAHAKSITRTGTPEPHQATRAEDVAILLRSEYVVLVESPRCLHVVGLGRSCSAPMILDQHPPSSTAHRLLWSGARRRPHPPATPIQCRLE